MDNIFKNGTNSVLDMKDFYFSNLSVKNDRVGLDELKLDVKHEITYFISKDSPNDYKVEITTIIDDEKKSLYIKVECVGIFELKNIEYLSVEEKDYLIKRNTVAIMYPFIRSQVSLLTTQPGVAPIMIPLIDVDSLVEEQE